MTNEPHRLTDFLHAMAGEYHSFYHKHTVLSDNLPLSAARLGLCEATRIVMRNGLSILGIEAPERM
jgi:arginyl-tRNA synthetase